MKELVAFLREMAGTGEIITIAYGGGSRPGEARQLVVASCSDSDFRAYEEGSRQAKQYKIQKILWAEDSFGRKITSNENVQAFESALPRLETLGEYVDLLKQEFESTGWYVHQSNNLFGVGACFKNGKPKKTPSIAIRYIDRSTELVWDLEKNDLVSVQKELTGRERPWRVDSWRFKEGKSFGLLQAAMQLFVEEVKASDPQQAKGIFAGH